jgi:hypothetical protein
MSSSFDSIAAMGAEVSGEQLDHASGGMAIAIGIGMVALACFFSVLAYEQYLRYK